MDELIEIANNAYISFSQLEISSGYEWTYVNISFLWLFSDFLFFIVSVVWVFTNLTLYLDKLIKDKYKTH